MRGALPGRREGSKRRGWGRHTGRAARLGRCGEAGDDRDRTRGGGVLLEEFLVYIDRVEPLGMGDGEGGAGRRWHRSSRGGGCVIWDGGM